jgi:hypothetical protein
MVLLWLFDQHRLQPWAYQAALMAFVLATVPSCRALTLVRLLTVSIYVFSAISKLDYTFLHSLGPQFTQSLLDFVGASSANWTDSQRLAAALLFPLGELFIALLLAIPHTRRLGAVLAIVMHSLLLLVLGPLGMKQQPAVLIWNIEFIVLAWLLFGRKRISQANLPAKAEDAARATNWLSHAATGILLFAVGFPLLEPRGWCDHWLAWGLYSPGASRAQVFVRPSDVESLPRKWRQYISPGQTETPWLRMRLDRWSLASLHAPLYPQARFQLGVALAVANALPPGRDVRVELFSAAHRLTGEREQTSLQTRPQLEAALRDYWLNAMPTKR